MPQPTRSSWMPLRLVSRRCRHRLIEVRFNSGADRSHLAVGKPGNTESVASLRVIKTCKRLPRVALSISRHDSGPFILGEVFDEKQSS